MKNIFKIPIISLLGAGGILLAFLFPNETQAPVAAQTQVPPVPSFVCDEPIPIGEVIEETLDFMDKVFKEYQSTQTYLDLALDSLNAAWAKLEKSPEEVCDFSVCSPEVVNRGGEFIFGIENLPFLPLPSLDLPPFRPPICEPKECKEEPCPDLNKFLKEIKTARAAALSSSQVIEDLFSQEVPVTEDLRETKEETTITKEEELRRKLKLARMWLYPYVGAGKRTCALSKLERAKVAAGELAERFPLKCTEALEQGLYWPRAWSENCKDDCEKGPTDDCKTCLGGDPGIGASFLAQVNFKIYGICKDDCREELTPACKECLGCAKFAPGGECAARLSEEELVAWICGGSSYNWVCCHGAPLE